MDSKQTPSLWTLLRPSVRLIILSWSTSSTSTAAKGKSADGSLTSWITEGRQRWSAVPVPSLSASSLVYHKGASGSDPACSSFTSMTFLTPWQPKLVSLRMTAAYKVVTCPDDQTQLQRDLNQLAEWEKWCDMAFHPGDWTSLPLQETPGTPVRTTWTETVGTAKCLGVTISRDMNWSKHINNVCTKANKTLAFLKRNLKICSRKIKEMAYKSCVRPALEYACTVWDPYTQQYIDRIEAIQRRAGVSSCNDIEDLKWTSLQGRRKTARLAMLYRIHNNIIATDGIKNKLQPPPPHPTHINDKDTTSSSRSNTAEPSTSSTHSCREPSETGMTCPRKSLRPRPSTHCVEGLQTAVIQNI